MDFGTCVWRSVLRDIQDQAVPMGVGIVVLGIIAALLVLVGGDPAAALSVFLACLYVALLVVGIIIVLSVITSVIACAAAGINQGITGVTGVAPADGQALIAADCPSAQAALAQAQNAFDAALAARNAARTQADQARRRVNAATQTVLAAMLAIAGVSFFRPDLLIAAIAAAVATGIVLARRILQLAAAEARLRAAEDALVACAAWLGAAQALVDQLCGQGPPVGIVHLTTAPALDT